MVQILISDTRMVRSAQKQVNMIRWASTWENLSSGVLEQHRRRPACASAQSDQRFCYSLFGKYHMLTCYRWNLNVLASLCSWGDLFETRFVGNPEDRFSRVAAQIIPQSQTNQSDIRTQTNNDTHIRARKQFAFLKTTPNLTLCLLD